MKKLNTFLAIMGCMIFFTVLTFAETENINTRLTKAISQGNINAVQRILKEGAKVNVRGDKGLTPLHAAVLNNQTEIAKLLISKGADVKAVDDTNGNNVLMMAAENNNVELLKIFLKKGININVKNDKGQTALDLVSDHNFKPLRGLAIKFLVDNGAPISNETKQKLADSLDNYAKSDEDSLAILEVIGPDYTKTKTYFLARAAGNNWQKTAKWLVNAGVDINGDALTNKPVLCYVIFDSRNDFRDPKLAQPVKLLLDLGANPDTNCNGQSAAAYAASNLNINQIKLLLEAGAKKEGLLDALIDHAVPMETGDYAFPMIKDLLEGDEAYAKSYFTLQGAVKKGHIDVVAYLLDRNKYKKKELKEIVKDGLRQRDAYMQYIINTKNDYKTEAQIRQKRIDYGAIQIYFIEESLKLIKPDIVFPPNTSGFEASATFKKGVKRFYTKEEKK